MGFLAGIRPNTLNVIHWIRIVALGSIPGQQDAIVIASQVKPNARFSDPTAQIAAIEMRGAMDLTYVNITAQAGEDEFSDLGGGQVNIGADGPISLHAQAGQHGGASGEADVSIALGAQPNELDLDHYPKNGAVPGSGIKMISDPNWSHGGGQIFMELPTANPHRVGQLWNNGGVVTVSAG